MDRGKKSIKKNTEKALWRITYAELFLYERMQEKLPAAKVSVISRQWQIRGGKFFVYEKFFEIIKNILYYLYYCV